MSTQPLEEVLDELSTRPPEVWQQALRLRFSDDTLVRHALIWLRANRETSTDQRRPDLGSDRYHLEMLLDRGATATVWQTYDRKLGRNVAIKVFHEERSDALAEILAEARSACEVVSDHVVRVHDVHVEDPPYIVMELVGEHDPVNGALSPGTSAARCRPRDLDEAVHWVRDIARGVHDAHLRNVFHRDLKPHNVLITPYSRRAKIADFGLAIGGNGERVSDTRSGLLVETPHGPARIIGTPEYMSPEQARGLPLALDPGHPEERATLVRVDVWGLGAVACALVGGQPPWRAPERAEVWELAGSGAPPWIPERMPDGRRIPGRLRRIIARALAVDPAERYATAAELATELDAYLERRPTSVDHGVPIRAALWARRNPRLSVTLVAVLVLGVMLTTTFASVVRLRDERAALMRDRARLARENVAARASLDQTEQTLVDRSAALGALQRAASDAQLEYKAIITTKEKALRSADRATRDLAGELEKLRNDRNTAETTRDLYEGFWKRSRTEAEATGRELEIVELERDRWRNESERALKERDLARAARLRAEAERDAAETERARTNAIRRRLEVDLATLAGELASVHQDVPPDAAHAVPPDAPRDAN